MLTVCNSWEPLMLWIQCKKFCTQTLVWVPAQFLSKITRFRQISFPNKAELKKDLEEAPLLTYPESGIISAILMEHRGLNYYQKHTWNTPLHWRTIYLELHIFSVPDNKEKYVELEKRWNYILYAGGFQLATQVESCSDTALVCQLLQSWALRMTDERFYLIRKKLDVLAVNIMLQSLSKCQILEQNFTETKY